MKNRYFAAILMALCCIFAVPCAHAASPLVKKVKKGQGIEVVYRSLYKGKVRPGELVMTVIGNEVSLAKAGAEAEEAEANG